MSGEPARSRGLGKGLAALLGDAPEIGIETPSGFRMIPIERLRPNPRQPRQIFEEAELESLAASIREKGVVQPLVARDADDGYEIVAGERRWRAAQRAGLHDVPVLIRSLTDLEALEIALVENLQRRDLRPLEEAEAYARLIRDYNHRQEDVAAALGKSRSHIANMIRLLELPDRIKALVNEGTLSAGHARALLSAPDAENLAREVAQRKLNVRQTERLVRDAIRGKTRPAGSLVQQDPNLAALETELGRTLGLKITIKPRGAGGTLTVSYGSLEQLETVVSRLRGP